MAAGTNTLMPPPGGKLGRRNIAPLRSFLQRLLTVLDTGQLTVELPSGERIVQRGAHPGPEAVLVLHRWRALWRMMAEGELGFSRSYIDGDCSTPDIKT